MNAIEVDGLTKIYRLYGSPKDRVKEWLSPSGKKYHHKFYALRDLSLAVETGETVGIIGENGSGKSTLLKILTGIVRPTSGIVRVNGRVSSLLELGAGFHPEFTGRNNVYMNGALMGLSWHEMDRRFPEIESFADIGEFVDQPVRTYSSGMYMRLAFSAAINVDPDILIIDEILSVGDGNFQSKCRQKIQDLRQRGKTILLVSHDMFTVENLCGKVCLLDHGRCLAQGKPADVIPAYHDIVRRNRVGEEGGPSEVRPVADGPQETLSEFEKFGTKDVEITGVYFIDDQGQPVPDLILAPNGRLLVRIEFQAHRRIDRPIVGIAIHRDDGVDVARSNTRIDKLEIPFIDGKGAVEYRVERLPLIPGRFYFTAAVSDYDVFVPYDIWLKCLSFTIVKKDTERENMGVVCLDNIWTLVKS